MSEDKADEPTADDETSAGVGGYLYRLALAGVGAVMLAQEELEARFKRRVETPSQEGEPLPPGPTMHAERHPSDEGYVSGEGQLEGDGEGGRAFFSQIDATVATFLNKLVPGRAEMDALVKEIEALEAEVEALKQG